MKWSDTSGKLVRWSILLPELKFEVVHHEDTNHKAADKMSGVPTKGDDGTLLGDKVPVLSL